MDNSSSIVDNFSGTVNFEGRGPSFSYPLPIYLRQLLEWTPERLVSRQTEPDSRRTLPPVSRSETPFRNETMQGTR